MIDRSKEAFNTEFGSTKTHSKMLDDPESVHFQNLLKIARNGHPEHMDKLVNHRMTLMRMTVAQHGQDRHRDQLMHDKSAEVRREVAIHGADVHHDHLMHDPDNDVKHAVVDHGNQSHVEHLMHDPHPFVSGHAKTRYAREFADDWMPSDHPMNESVLPFKQFTKA